MTSCIITWYDAHTVVLEYYISTWRTGHGGDGFLKFQDSEEISNFELGDAFEQMWQKRRYNELLFLIDTCQAGSMLRTFYSPNIVGCGSSAVNQDSLSVSDCMYLDSLYV